MRTLLPSALATLVTCLPVLAQTFGYEIDVNPPRNENANNPTLGEWLNPNEITGQYYSDGFRIRILAEPGTWVRPLFDFKLDEQLTSGEPPAWLANNPWLENIGTMTSLQGLSSPLASVFGSTPNQLEIHGYENVVIPGDHAQHGALARIPK